MKRITFLLLISILLCGCASSVPLLTGKPQDWKGKPADDLRAGWGEPTHVMRESNGDEVWEYREAGNRVIPKGESMSFGFAGIGSPYGGAGGFSSEKRPEDRVSHEENVCRFKIRDGKIRDWYAARIIDGRTVWEDH